MAVLVDAQNDIRRCFTNHVVVAYVEHDGIHKYDGIDGCQRSLLPGFNLRQQLVRDRRYHAFTHVEAVDVPDLI